MPVTFPDTPTTIPKGGTPAPRKNNVPRASSTRKLVTRTIPRNRQSIKPDDEHFNWEEDLEEILETKNKADAESDDLETVLGDDDAQERLYDHAEVCCQLYLRKCRLLGVTPISKLLRQLKCADKELNLHSHNCGPKAAQALAAPLVINTSLVHLDLGGNSIQDEGVGHLTQALAEDTCIQHLDLSENKLTALGVKQICRLVLLNNHLHSLNISGNHFGDSAASFLSAMMEKCRNLQELNLSHNDLGSRAGVLLGPAIGANDTLQVLDLSWNQLRCQGAISIAKGLKENIRLRVLQLGWNGFGVEGAESLGNALMENTCLQKLDLTNNRLTDPAVVLFAKGLERNEALNTLTLRSNPMTNAGAVGIIKALQRSGASALKTVDINDVTVREDFVESLQELNNCQAEPLVVKYSMFNIHSAPASPSSALVSFLVKQETNLLELFPLDTNQAENNYIAKEDFLEKITSVAAPLNSQQLSNLTRELANTQSGLLDLSPLFVLEEKLSQSNPKQHTEILIPSLQPDTLSDVSNLDNKEEEINSVNDGNDIVESEQNYQASAQ